MPSGRLVTDLKECNGHKGHYDTGKMGYTANASKDDPEVNEVDIYPFRSLNDIKSQMQEKGWHTLKEVALAYENASIDEDLDQILKEMFACVEHGLHAEGMIPANSNPALRWKRVAGRIEASSHQIQDRDSAREMRLTAYAYAVGEQHYSSEELLRLTLSPQA